MRTTTATAATAIFALFASAPRPRSPARVDPPWVPEISPTLGGAVSVPGDMPGEPGLGAGPGTGCILSVLIWRGESISPGEDGVADGIGIGVGVNVDGGTGTGIGIGVNVDGGAGAGIGVGACIGVTAWKEGLEARIALAGSEGRAGAPGAEGHEWAPESWGFAATAGLLVE